MRYDDYIQSTLEDLQISGDYGKEVPPVPIPNTVVKLFSADDT